MEMFLKITAAVILLMLVWRLYPAAKEWLENGPRGDSEDWKAAIIPLLLVAGFVALLMVMVRG